MSRVENLKNAVGEAIKSYENNPNPLKKYNELLNFYLNDLKNKGYSTLNFDIIFESFFPKPNKGTIRNVC
jgi:hypothetical protein